MMNLFEREASKVCTNSQTAACPSSIPFCCPINTTCMSLDSDNTSVLCCPEGQTCNTLRPVSCDLSSQNAIERPLSTLQTTDFDTPLLICGTACCPRGYSCNNGQCFKGSGVTTPSTSTSSTSISPAAATATATVTATPLSSNFPAPAIIVGVAVGLLAGAFFTWLIIWLLRRRRQRKHMATKLGTESYNGSSRAPTFISDPIVATPFGGAQRADFLLRTASGKELTGNAVMTPATTNTASTKKRSPLFSTPLKYGLPLSLSKSPKRPLRSDEHLEADGAASKESEEAQASHNIKDDDPVPDRLTRHNSDESYITTGSQHSSQRPASTETISVGLMPPAPPMMGGRNAILSTNTTFSQMMEQAGMRRGDGFLGYPGRWSFRA